MAKTNGFRLGPKQRRWLKMLETTRRKQCRMALHEVGEGYCCLGIAELSLGKKPSELVGLSVLSRPTREALGMNDMYGSSVDGILPDCTSMNDADRLSFREIAAHLRKHASKYFARSA